MKIPSAILRLLHTDERTDGAQMVSAFFKISIAIAPDKQDERE
jgi:hypothetical protein